MKHTCLVLSLFALAACSHVDHDQVDYRIGSAPTGGEKKCKDKNQCDTIVPAKLERRYMPAIGYEGIPLTTGDYYSIELEQGVAGVKLLEGIAPILGEFGYRMGDDGEIAILANVFEFSASSGDAVKGFVNGSPLGPADQNAFKDIKLIYYSENVRRKQAFNFSNIPMVPRSRYEGGSIGVQIVVMELDSNDSSISSLLTTLADVGKNSMPLPPVATDIVFDLGKSLASGGSGDDILLDYRFVLSGGIQHQGATSQTTGAYQARATPGRYVIRRVQDRTKPMVWHNLSIDHNTGRLFREGADAAFEEVRDEFYLTLHLKRFDPSSKAEFVKFEQFGDFRTKIEESLKGRITPEELTAVAKTFVGNSKSLEFAATLLDKWRAAKEKLDVFEQLAVQTQVGPGTDTKCAARIKETILYRDEAEWDAQRRVAEFLRHYETAIAPEKAADGTATPSAFKPEDEEDVIAVIVSELVPWPKDAADERAVDGLDRADFQTASAFRMAFLGSGATKDLAAISTKMAKLNAKDRPMPTCEQILN